MARQLLSSETSPTGAVLTRQLLTTTRGVADDKQNSAPDVTCATDTSQELLLVQQVGIG
jgi:hypothetical protein